MHLRKFRLPGIALALALAWVTPSVHTLEAQTASILQFSAARYTANENSGGAVIAVQRSGSTIGAVSVDYNILPGVGAEDNVSTGSGTLTWADGDAADKTFFVPIFDDTIVNTRSDVSLALNNQAGNVTLGVPSTSALTLVDNDAATIQPTVTITSPPADISVEIGASVPLAASVNDPSGILSHVQFFLNGRFFDQTSSTGPLVLNATAPPLPGDYRLQAVAVDQQGRQSPSVIRTVRVLPPVSGATPPSADIITDADGRAYVAGSNLTLSINANEGTGGSDLTRVDVFADGVLVASFDGLGNPLPLASGQPSNEQPTRREGDAPFSDASIFRANVPLPNASKIVNIVAVALNKLGRSQVSAPVNVQTIVTANRPPAVTLAGLPNGRSSLRIGRTVNIQALITDPNAPSASASRTQPERREFDPSTVVSRVEYYLNELKVKDAAQAPFSFDVTPPAAGTFVLTAIVTDKSGLTSVSPPLRVRASEGALVNLAVGGSNLLLEGGKNGKAIFTRDGGDVSQPLTVFYQLKGSAKNGKDYRDISGQPLGDSITFPAGETRLKLKIVPRENSKAELTEKLNLVLLPSPTDEYDLGDSIKAKFQIFDND
jgi:hypothetical protein